MELRTLLCTALLLAGSMYACESAPVEKQDLTTLTIEQLMDVEVEVTSASRKEQKLSETAAAVYVIARDDIRRAGSATVAEALRLAPGMNVARIDANKWAVSCRGFNDLFANKMLVLVDGRSVYTPTFSGVWWDALGVEIEDVDRIEVIRGPGAAVWGANAVNAIVNIITAPATSGRAVSAKLQGGSSDIQSGSSLRFCGPFSDQGGYRFYASHTLYNALDRITGGESNDAWDRSSAGIRMDWSPDEKTTASCHVNTYRGSGSQDYTTNLEMPIFSEILSDSISVSGTNLLARLSHRLSPTSDQAIQFYYDRSHRDDRLLYGEALETYDLDYQHHFSAGKHDLIWGLGYRLTDDTVLPGQFATFVPPHRKQSLFSGFINDEITLADDRLRLTLGTKIEHNDFTGWEIQPSARLLCPLRNNDVVWTALSRAVRMPARMERDIIFTMDDFPDGEGGRVKFLSLSSPDFQSEELLAYELGYRRQASHSLTLDAACFLNHYSNIMSIQFGEPYVEGDSTIYPGYLTNQIYGKTYGAELAVQWTVKPTWRLAANYSLFYADLERTADCNDTLSLPKYEGSTPRSQFHIRSYCDLPGNRQLDIMLYRCSALTGRLVPGFTRLDGRLSWHTSDGTNISIQITNALNSRHVEFGSFYGETVSLLQRGVSASIARQF